MTEIKSFKAYDVRGQLGSEINVEIVYRIARAYAEFLNAKKVVVGADVRLTSNELKASVAKGLTDAGVDVIDLGLTGTEEVYFATNYFDADGGIEITASHNPIDHNGMKMVKEKARPLSADTGLKEIRAIAEKNQFITPDKVGTLSKASCLEAYADHIMSYVDVSRFDTPLRLVINSGNGAAGHAVDIIEERIKNIGIPIELIKVHHEEDGTFPHGIPNPMLEENRKDTAEAVIKNKADMGIAFDGDFDRCFFFDETGRFIEGYYIVGLLAEAFLMKNPGEKIVYDPRVTWNTIDIVEKAGGTAVQSKSGHSFIKDTMREHDAIYGGEMSAHHYFRDFAYCDSGMIPWLLVSELVSNRKKSLASLVEERMSLHPSSGEINSKVENTDETIAKVLSQFKDEAINIDDTDGISVEFADWRFNLRASNTEPVIRLNVESRVDGRLLEEKTGKLLSIISGKYN